MNNRTIEYGAFAQFEKDGTKYSVYLGDYTIQEVFDEFDPDTTPNIIDGWAVVDSDGCARDYDVFQSRNEAMLDQFGEDDWRELR